jgi:hypothetical protein
MSNVPWGIKLRRQWFHRQSARRVESAFSTMRRRNNSVVFRLIAIQRSAQKMVRPVIPENLIRADSRHEAESAHHST